MKLGKFEIDSEKLYDLAKAKNEEFLLNEDLYSLRKFFNKNFDARFFYEDEYIDGEKKKKLLKEFFKAKSKIFWQLSDFLIEKGQMRIMARLFDAYSGVLSQKEKVEFAVVETAQEASADIIGEIQNKVGKKIYIRIEDNPKIIGGFILSKPDGTVIDGSIKGRLEKLKRGMAK